MVEITNVSPMTQCSFNKIRIWQTGHTHTHIQTTLSLNTCSLTVENKMYHPVSM